MPLSSVSLGAVVDAAFADDGVLARSIADYEPRPGQRQMAAAVAGTIEAGGTLLAEAGTGTGKTLAYLIPAILSGQRVLVSTGTKNLQEQILLKDVPALGRALGRPFTTTLMKGRANYLCLHRWELYRAGVEGNTPAQGRLVETGDRVLLPIIEEWLTETTTGDRAELSELPEDLPAWRDLSATGETCLGSECPRHGDCFVTLMRQRAAESDVVIVNHHLLCADASVRQSAYGEVIPSCPTLVVDEAHQLEDVATQYFGYAAGSFRVDELVRDARRVLGAADQSIRARLERGAAEALAQIDEAAAPFFSGLESSSAQARAGPESRIRYTGEMLEEHAPRGQVLASAVERLESALRPGGRSDAGAAAPGGAAGDDGIESLAGRASDLCRDLRRLLRADDPDFVYFIERRARGLILRAAPIDVSRIVRDEILGRFRSVVLTSATLAVDASFEYVTQRLGVRQAGELRVPSEFDFAAQALLYLPRRMPQPRLPGFAEAVAREAIAIVRRSRGRAFVLFTSYAVLRTVQPLMEMALPFPILAQGSAPRSTLIERFRRTPHAVLLGTSSFWQGVDVAGDALSCVVIDKLPFASPADPVTAARIDAIRAAGGDAFSEYQVPLAILALQQGLGRLIRHRADRGVLAILDPRLRTMGYGRRFLAALPPAPVTDDLDAIERFFK
jgi:ATP-dependent DNA helicase DinG